MKILIDMNLSHIWVETFAIAGIEAVHWSTIGAPNAKDRLLMAWAYQNQYTVFTHDLDFGALLASTQASAPSVIQVRTQDTLPSAIGDLLIAVIRQFQSELESGALLTIDKARARILPIN
jgi:predicted nuclease of predicted toxin-antitoxin system